MFQRCLQDFNSSPRSPNVEPSRTRIEILLLSYGCDEIDEVLVMLFRVLVFQNIINEPSTDLESKMRQLTEKLNEQLRIPGEKKYEIQ